MPRWGNKKASVKDEVLTINEFDTGTEPDYLPPTDDELSKMERHQFIIDTTVTLVAAQVAGSSGSFRSEFLKTAKMNAERLAEMLLDAPDDSAA